MRFKQAMKRGAVAARRLLPRPDPSTRRVVLCYHSVHPTRSFLTTRPELFDRHLQWLAEHCRITSLVELVGGPRPNDDDRPVVAITFDDGYEDNHSYALPILLKRGATATFFLTAGFLERDERVLHRLRDLLGAAPEEIVPLDWSQARELQASGMDIGSHTYGHPNLARLSPAEAREELQTSKQVIGDRLGSSVALFAYPFGKPRVHFTTATVDAVRAAGYQTAAAVTFRGVRPSDSRFEVPRFFTDGDSLGKLEAKILGDYELVGWWQAHVPLPMLKLVSPDDFKR